MEEILLTPYSIIENTDYSNVTKIVIRESDFTNVPFQDGRITFSFIGCRFKKLEIENTETIDFKNISIQFFNCFINEINVERIITTNFSIYFFSSILQGKIKNENLRCVEANNCLLNNSFFLLDLQRVVISYTEENVFPIRWKKLLKSVNATLENLLAEKHSFYIYDCKDIVFTYNENTTSKSGLYKIPYDSVNKIGYYLSDEEKKKIKVGLNVQYLYQTPITWTKKSNWLSYSRIINWG